MAIIEKISSDAKTENLIQNADCIITANCITARRAKKLVRSCEGITLEIPEGFEKICKNAFDGLPFNHIKRMIIPSSVRVVEEEAFKHCWVEEIIFKKTDDNILFLKPKAFYCCYSKNIIFYTSEVVMEYACFAESSASNITFFGHVNSIPESCFKDSKIEQFSIPTACSKISTSAFYNCVLLQEIKMPTNTIEIESYAFSNCRSLKNIVLSTLKIPDFCFWRCSSLEEVKTFNVTEIGSGAFSCCENLELFKSYNETVAITIKDKAFLSCNSLKNFSTNLPICNIIGDSAFESCENLSHIDLTCVEKIGSRAFLNAKSLKSIVLNNAKVIESVAFANCTSLRSIEFPQSLECIGQKAFVGCNRIEKIIIPEGVKEIEGGAFKNCEWLTSVELNTPKLDKISKSLFKGCIRLKEFKVSNPSAIISIEEEAFCDCIYLESLPIFEKLIYIKDASFCNCENLKEIKFGSMISEIGARAFYGCKRFVNIELPTSVHRIGNETFVRCFALENVVMPRTSIMGSEVFRDCINLKKIEFTE